MFILPWITLLTAAAPVQATATPLRGDAVSGKIVSVSEQQVQLETAAGPRTLPAAQLHALQLLPDSAPIADIAESTMAVRLVDGSILATAAFRVENGHATVELPFGAKVEFAARFLHSVRLAKQDAVVQKQWQEMLDRSSAADRLVLRKMTAGGAGGSEATAVALDHLQGVVRDIRDETVGFDFDGTRVDVPRKKIEGIIYFHPPGSLAAPSCRLSDASGSTWNLRSLRWLDGDLELVTVAGVRHVLPAAGAAKIDYSAGSLVYLSDLQPEAAEWQPYIEATTAADALAKWFKPRVDGSIYGGPMQLDGQDFDRGLALHSRTLIAYRLTEDYQQLLATVGIDDRFRSSGNVRLVISGEKGPLWEKVIGGKDAPFELEVDVRGVRRLQILVDFGDDQSDVGDHLNLCNARLTK